jgi:hypothetical protein
MADSPVALTMAGSALSSRKIDCGVDRAYNVDRRIIPPEMNPQMSRSEASYHVLMWSVL